MAFTVEQIEIIKQIPKGTSVYEQILYLAEKGINLSDTQWGTPTDRQAQYLGWPTALVEQKMEGGLVQR